MFDVVPLTEFHVPHITDIFNHEILHSTGIFRLDPVTREDRLQWVRELERRGRPRLVAVVPSTDIVAGYCVADTFRPHPAYAQYASY
jgi:phosphinothricin acetyltransferase